MLFHLYRHGGRAFAPLISAHIKRKYGSGLLGTRVDERFGQASRPRPDGRLIWVHAASLGETRSILGLIDALHLKRPDWTVLLTNWTESAANLSNTVTSDRLIPALAPLDLSPVHRRFLNHWQPDAALFVESELWPGWVDALARRQIPLALVNARLSARSAARWARMPRLSRALMERYAQVIAQTPETAEHLQQLGLPAERLSISGDLKSAAAPLAANASDLGELQKAIGKRPVWAAASTHPGEEEAVLAAHAALRAQHKDALLLLIPRHPERAEMLERLASQSGETVTRRSQNPYPSPSTTTFIADSFGEMGLWYRLACSVFLGGSLVPLGGHNPYEPARLGTALLTGPYISNFKAPFASLIASDAALQVTAETLPEAVLKLFSDNHAAQMAERAKAVAAQTADIPGEVCDQLLRCSLAEL